MDSRQWHEDRLDWDNSDFADIYDRHASAHPEQTFEDESSASPEPFSSPELDKALVMLSDPSAVPRFAKETGAVAGDTSMHDLSDCLDFCEKPPPIALKMTRHYQHGSKDRGESPGPWVISLNGQREMTDGHVWLTSKIGRDSTTHQFLEDSKAKTKDRRIRCRLCNAVFFGKYKKEYEKGCPFNPSKLQHLWQHIFPRRTSNSVAFQVQKFLTALQLFPNNNSAISVDMLCITQQENALRACWVSRHPRGDPRATLHLAIMHIQKHGWVAVTEVAQTVSGYVGYRYQGRLPGKINTTECRGITVRYMLPSEFKIKETKQSATATQTATAGPATPTSDSGSRTPVRTLSLLLGRHWGPLHAGEMRKKLQNARSVTPPRSKRSPPTNSNPASKRVCFRDVTEKDVENFLALADKIASGLHRGKIAEKAREKFLSLATRRRLVECKKRFNQHLKPNTTKFSTSGSSPRRLRPASSPPRATTTTESFSPEMLALYSAVAMITCLTRDGNTTYSTATCVCQHRGFFLAARHAFPAHLDDVLMVLVHQYCPVSQQPKLVCLASVLPEEQPWDIAMLAAWVWPQQLELDGVKPRALPLQSCSKTPVPPDPICHIGFPKLDGDCYVPYIFMGKICAPTTANECDCMTLKVDVTAYPGQSGAPIVDDSGKLIGVLTEAPGADARGGGGVKYAQWLDEHTVSFLERVSGQASSDWITSAPVTWGRHEQTARESKPEASATFYTPTAARASAPIPQRSAAAASGGADPSPSGWSMRDQILRVMRGQPAGASMTAIEIAKRLGG